MKFSARYPVWVILPPLLIGGPLAFFFLTQVVQMTLERWFLIVGIGALAYVPVTFFYWRHLHRLSGEVNDAVELRDVREVSIALTDCLLGTEIAAMIYWPVIGVVFSATIGLLMTPTVHGVTAFVESSLIVATIAMAWTYWAGKKILLRHVTDFNGIHYRGRTFSFRVKIVMVFVGFFMVSTGAMVQLVSSRVLEALETEAIESGREQFERVVDALAGDASPARIRQLVPTLDADQALHLVDFESGEIVAGEALEPAELSTILALGTGDSLQIQSDRALLFRESGGSIVVMTLPIEHLRLAREIEYYAAIIAVMTTLLFLVATWFLGQDLTAPVDKMIGVSESMAAGDFTTIGSVFSDDEVGLLSTTMFDTRENLRRLLSAVGSSGESVTRGVRVIRDGAAVLVDEARSQKELTESSASAVIEVRDVAESILKEADEVGDLTRDSSARAIELQSSAEEVSRNMEHLFESVETTSSSVVQIDSSANETSRRAELLAGVGEEVLSYVSEMDSTVDQFRQSTRDTADVSKKVREVARSGAEAVADTVKGIEQARLASKRTSDLLAELQKNIGEINLVVKVIEELAENTNLLSLNASIIAAQAGDRDMGFSVVAEEIRQLADRTRESTGEIHQIIRVIAPATDAAVRAMKSGLGEVEKSVILSEKASSALEEIGESADRSSEMNEKIASALEQHSEASRHLLKIASGISEEIAAISNATREEAVATRHLAKEAERVREIAGQVRRSTEEQSLAAGGITQAMERIAGGEERIRGRLRAQLESTDQIASAAETLEQIAKRSDQIAGDFTRMMQELAASGRSFETEFARFRLDSSEPPVTVLEGGGSRSRTLKRIAH